MKVTYFSWLRTKTGVAAESLELPPSCGTVESLVQHLATRHPALGEIAGAQGSLRCTVNRRYVEPSHPLQATDTVGFFPPVTGG